MKTTSEKIDLTIESIGINGEGIAHSNGTTYFVPFTLPGERVAAKVQFYKQGAAFCSPLKILEPSPERVQPICKVYGSCGGCVYQHTDYLSSLRYKKQSLSQTLSKIGGYNGEIDDVIPSEPCLGYRNKLQLPFGMQNGMVCLGFYKEGTHQVVPTETCALHGDWADRIIKTTLAFAHSYRLDSYDEHTGKGLLRHLVVRNLSGLICVTVVINGNKLPYAESYFQMLEKEFGHSVSLYVSINKQATNVIMGDKLIHLFGGGATASVMGINISVGPLSFFQVNDYIRTKIYTEIINRVNAEENSVVIDAYSGVGLLGAILAKSGAQIHNIEIIPEAVSDADKLYKANGLTAKNICGDSGTELPKKLKALTDSGIQDITVILDPPRKGCAESVLSSIIDTSKTIKGFKLLYLSCNPATLARDLKQLSSSFDVKSVTPYDMFAYCKGLETLVELVQR